jgi:glycosyltransferase involved in cell wall biosynthesis
MISEPAYDVSLPGPHGASARLVLYVNHDFPPMSGPGIWRALSFVTRLALAGHRVTVLCGTRSHWSNRYDDSLLHAVPSTVRVRRLKSLFTTKWVARLDEVASTARVPAARTVAAALSWRLKTYYPDQYLVWLLQAAGVGAYLALSRRFDCVITSGPSHLSHVVGWMIRRLRKTVWIVDYRDLWTDDAAQFPQSGYQARLFRAVERRAIRSADAVVTVSPAWQRHLKTKFGRPQDADKFFLIRNGHDLDDLSVDGADADRHERLHVHFNGTPQVLSRTTALLDGLCLLRSSLKPADCLPLVSFTGFNAEFEREVHTRRLEEVVVDVHAMTKQQSIEYSLRSDVLLVIVNSEIALREGTIPAKTYEAMALGRHVLAILPRQSDVRKLLAEYGNATLCDVDDPKDICAALEKLIQSHREHRLNTESTIQRRQPILTKYSREAQARQLLSLIDALCARSHPVIPTP